MTLNFRVIKDCVIQGKKYAEGDDVDIDTTLANALMGKYISADKPEPENRSVGLERSDSKPTKRSKKVDDAG